MSKILVLVEGETEEQFVKGLLAPHFADRGIYIVPKITTTKRQEGKPHFKGGVANYHKVKHEVVLLCRDSSAICITTMLDYYGLPDDFPGMQSKLPGTKNVHVQHIEQEFAKDISDRRFLPYLAVHEFETVLFSAPDVIAQQFSELNISAGLREIRERFDSPEDINDQMPPSKWLLKLIPYYQKPADGLAIAKRIGLEQIRLECPHFNQWISTLEQLK